LIVIRRTQKERRVRKRGNVALAVKETRFWRTAGDAIPLGTGVGRVKKGTKRPGWVVSSARTSVVPKGNVYCVGTREREKDQRRSPNNLKKGKKRVCLLSKTRNSPLSSTTWSSEDKRWGGNRERTPSR